MKLNIGCGRNPAAGYINLDRTPGFGVDCVFDLEHCHPGAMPWADNTFDQIVAYHVLEHITNILPLMQELHRVAKPDCELRIHVPWGRHDSAYEDPTHVRVFFWNSFTYFGQSVYGGADYGYRGDWALNEVVLVLSPGVREELLEADNAMQMDMLNSLWNLGEELRVRMSAKKPIRIAGTFLEDVKLAIHERKSTNGD